MARAKKLFYKIGEVCEICQIQPHVLRYWETEFSVLSPTKNNAGQRIYRQKDVELIQQIKCLLYEKGFTIAGANKQLLENGHANASELPLFKKDLLQASRQARIQQIRRDLEELLELLS
ncbi:MAG: MerR family transcriptional regulator [Acidobacteria bacterium]|nr:MerR family transcriptional regulator [Acidobacteriota bacterium]